MKLKKFQANVREEAFRPKTGYLLNQTKILHLRISQMLNNGSLPISNIQIKHGAVTIKA